MTTKSYLNTPNNYSFYFDVGDGHQLYVEECGNPNGIPVVFLHGGPGGSVGPQSRQFFDPEYFRVILFDQRGSGKSQPSLSLKANTVFDSVADIEKIRQYLKIERWVVFGGSYGSTLALTYAIHYPQRVMHMVLRGIFLGRKSDIEWLFQYGASEIYPDRFESFRSFIPVKERNDLVAAYYKRMTSDDQELFHKACKEWSDWENSILKMEVVEPSREITTGDLSGGLLEAHYFYHKMFWEEDNYLLNRADKLQAIPMAIYHGRFDIDCRVAGAYELKKACPHADLNIVALASHSPFEPPLLMELVKEMDRLKEVYSIK